MKQLLNIFVVLLSVFLLLSCGSQKRIVNLYMYETLDPLYIIDSITNANGINNYPLTQWNKTFMLEDGKSPLYNYYMVQTMGDSIYSFYLIELDSVTSLLKYKTEKK